MATAEPIQQRKTEHLALALGPDAEVSAPGWNDVQLVHHALPSVDAADVDLGAKFLGRCLRIPLVIAGMTGGHPDTVAVNRVLARAAERAGIAIGVGSQRAALRDSGVAWTYEVVRECAPSTLVIGNIGIGQLVDQDSEPALDRDDLIAAIAMVRADALAVHLNFLEESVQPEGQVRAAGAGTALAALAAELPVPLIGKETGAGLSRAVALRLRTLGIKAVDVGGLGGTSFAAIEAARARARGDADRAALGVALSQWGIPTAVSIAGCAGVLPCVATGGIRSGVDAAKAIALGADLVGVARPLLERAVKGEEAVLEWIDQFERQLRTAVFLTGGRRLADLRLAPRVILGPTRQWLEQLGYADAQQNMLL